MAKKSTHPTTSCSWHAGFAQCDITPRPGRVMMAGFGRERHAKGTLAPLRAQALALKPARGTPLILITADVLGIGALTGKFIRDAVAKNHGVDGAAVMIAVSHTHWGPVVTPEENFACGVVNPWYLKEFEATLVSLADQAMASLAPAHASYASAEVRLGRNRRLPREDGTIGWGPNPHGSYDTHTPILLIERTGQAPDKIVVAAHACHPTSTGAIDEWSPDYPGAMRDHIEKAMGPGAVAMFAMGCGADAKVTHLDDASGAEVFSAEPRRAAEAGVKLGEAVLAALRQGTHALPAQANAATADGALSYARRHTDSQLLAMARKPGADHVSWWARQMLTFPIPGKAFPIETVAWRFGDELLLLGLQQEVCSPFGPMLREMARGVRFSAIFAYTNCIRTYVPTAQIVREGGYEGDFSYQACALPARFTTRVESEYCRAVRKAIEAVSRR